MVYDKETFINYLIDCGFNKEEVLKSDLDVLFKQQVMEWILTNKNISPPTLVARFGFESENKAELYLKEPSFLSELKTQIKFPQKRISDELFQKLVSCYDKAILKQKESTSHDTQVLVSLFDVFELIKNLSDEEVTMFHANLPSFVRASYFQGSVKNFRNDLLNMNPLEFEIKYADCFNGFLENTIKSMINAESFYSMIDALEQPSENLSEKVSEPLEKLTESEQEILHRTVETYKPSSKLENYKNEMAKLIKGQEKIEGIAQKLSTKNDEELSDEELAAKLQAEEFSNLGCKR